MLISKIKNVLLCAVVVLFFWGSVSLHAESRFWNSFNKAHESKDNDTKIVNYTSAIESWSYADGEKSLLKAYVNRGNVYLLEKDYVKAIDDYNSAIELDAKNATVYINRGYTFLWLKKWEEAKKDFEKAIQLRFKLHSAYENLAIYYWASKKDKQKALMYFEKAFESGFDSWDDLTDDSTDGHFIKDLVQTPEFQELVKKYKK